MTDIDPNLNTESVVHDSAAADADAVSAFEESLKNLTAKIQSHAVKFEEAAGRQVPPAEPVAAVPPIDPEKYLADLTKIGSEEGFGPAAKRLVTDVVLPMFNHSLAGQAKANERELTREDSEYGAIYKDPAIQGRVKKFIKDNKIGDAYLADPDKSYREILKVVAFEELADERGRRKVKADEGRAALTPDQAGAPARSKGPASERPRVGPVSGAPAKIVTDDDRLASVAVSAEEIAIGREYFNMDEKEIRKERWEIKNWQDRLGPYGMKREGGIPICSIQDMIPKYKDTGEPMAVVKEEM